MNKLRTAVIGGLALCVLAVSAAGETIAVSVRSEQAPTEWTTPLLEDIEEGVMDALFDAGHIVFDIPAVVGQTGRLLYVDADNALAGGARRLLHIVVSFGRETTQGIAPGSGWATYVTVPQADELSMSRVAVSEIAGFSDMTPTHLSQELGARIARAALAGAEEVAW